MKILLLRVLLTVAMNQCDLPLPQFAALRRISTPQILPRTDSVHTIGNLQNFEKSIIN